MFHRIGLIVVAFAALMFVVAPAAAQYDPPKNWQKEKEKKKNTGPAYVAPSTGAKQFVPAGPIAAPVPAGAACVPSGFGRLTRNCAANTGACQRLPDQCNLGWCCP